MRYQYLTISGYHIFHSYLISFGYYLILSLAIIFCHFWLLFGATFYNQLSPFVGYGGGPFLPVYW